MKRTSLGLLSVVGFMGCQGAAGISEVAPNPSHADAGALGEAGAAADAARTDAAPAVQIDAASNGLSDAAADAPVQGPPGPISTHPPCVISVDCPQGQYCDLGECTQSCNTNVPCAGGLTCSPRGRCFEPGSADSDPPPVTKQQGIISAAPLAVVLTEHDATLEIKLKTTAQDAVRYRVQIDAPHLSIPTARGNFVGPDGVLTLNVSPRGITAADTAGSVKVITNLGTMVVNAPLHIGVTGTYHGALRYDGTSVPLGEAVLSVQLSEKNGTVSALIDAGRSLLFPKAADGAAVTGRGSYTSSGLEFTVNQRIEASVGADRNHFGRPIGRRLVFTLHPDQGGSLQGSFTEQVYGLFTQPVSLSGTVNLEFDPALPPPSFTLPPDPQMPSIANAAWAGPEVFGMTGSTCDALTGGKDVEATYYVPLENAMANRIASAQPMGNVANACRTALAATTVPNMTGFRCSFAPPLACAMRQIATKGGTTAENKKFGRLIAETLASALLVAKDETVAAVHDSFVQGTGAEKSRYDAAIKALSNAAAWVTQPAALEYLRRLQPAAAKGDAAPTDKTTWTAYQPYPSARALADLFHTAAAIDGERARLGSALGATAQADLIAQTQERALINFLEATTLLEVLDGWSAVPPAVAATLTGVLSPLNNGFSALLGGATTFGIADGFVPFLYDPRDSSAPSNFEQVLKSAGDALAQEQATESAFTSDSRQFEQDQHQLALELANVRTQYDARIKDLCGASFDPDHVTGPDDWKTCGADGSGQVGELQTQLAQAQAELASAQSRILGMKDKIAIDHTALRKTQAIHDETLTFVDQTGNEISDLVVSEGIVDATVKSIEVASNACLWNGFAPLAMSAAATVAELLKADMEKQKQNLQTAQQMRFEQANKDVEYVNGMANIQKETIDLAQLGVDIETQVLAATAAGQRVRNLLAEAKAIFEERGRQLAIADEDPARDPSFRLLRDSQALKLLQARADAQRRLYLAGQALAYEINQPISTLGGAALGANNALALSGLRACLNKVYADARQAFGNPQSYVSTVSVRKMLGITGPRTDAVTGQTLSEGEQFRQLLLRNENLDGRGGVGIVFATDLQPGNGLWAADLCQDRIESVQGELVGDFLGDNQAELRLGLTGAGLLRSCGTDALVPWSFGGAGSLAADAIAAVQAGVNSFGDAPPNTSLFGQPVARVSWRLVIPSGTDVPANADVDTSRLDDIVLKIVHRALPQRTTTTGLDLQCLGG